MVKTSPIKKLKQYQKQQIAEYFLQKLCLQVGTSYSTLLFLINNITFRKNHTVTYCKVSVIDMDICSETSHFRIKQESPST